MTENLWKMYLIFRKCISFSQQAFYFRPKTVYEMHFWQCVFFMRRLVLEEVDVVRVVVREVVAEVAVEGVVVVGVVVHVVVVGHFRR